MSQVVSAWFVVLIVCSAREFGMRGFAKDLLDVSDNFERAIEAAEKAVADSPAAQSLLEGVKMTENQLHNVLKKYGIEKEDPLGSKFDPAKHMALMEVDSDEHEPGYVVCLDMCLSLDLIAGWLAQARGCSHQKRLSDEGQSIETGRSRCRQIEIIFI